MDPSHPTPATALAPDDGVAEGLRIARRLEAEGVVEVVQDRPKHLVVAARPFSRALYGMLRTRPHLAPLMQGSALRVLAVLAAEHEEGRAPRVEDIAHLAGLSERTIRSVVRLLANRSLLAPAGPTYGLAAHAPELYRLGLLYRDHVLEEKLGAHPDVFPVALRSTRMLVESEETVEGLDPTAFYRFQIAGADVLSPRFQYALTFADEGTRLEDALADLKCLAPSPRTLRAAEEFMRSHTDG